MNQAVFRSGSAHLRVGFPADTFGYVQGRELEKDVLGNVLQDRDGQPIHKLALRREAKFGESPNPPGALKLDLDDPQQALLAKDLLRHPRYGVDFVKEDDAAADIAAQLAGKVVLVIPPVLTPDDRKLIASLATYYTKPIPPPALKPALELLKLALERFKVRGVIAPPEDRLKRLLVGRIRDLLFALEEAGVWTSPDAGAPAEGGPAEAVA